MQSKLIPRHGQHLAIQTPYSGASAYKRSFRIKRRGRSYAVASQPVPWLLFSERVSGEWEGSAATFDPEGHPQELPERFVPSAYREWGQTLHDWQTQCSSLAEGNLLLRKLKRLMPTVGCEADAIAFNEEQQSTEFELESEIPCSVFLPDGSYSLPCSLAGHPMEARAEHCFQIGDEERVRIVQLLGRADGKRAWRCTAIELHKERRECDYNGGKELAGCGGGMPGFATRERLMQASMEASWVPDERHFIRRGEAMPGTSDSSVEAAAILLPLKSWSIIDSNGASLKLRAGCFVSDEERMCVSQTYQEEDLMCISLGKELHSGLSN